MKLWDVRSWKSIAEHMAPSGIRSLAITPDGRYVVAGHYDGHARLYRLARAKATKAADEEQEDTDKSTTAKECLKQLQGTWTAIAPLGACGRRKTITFSGNRYKVVEGDDSVHTGTIQFVNLTGDPKSFDWDDDKGHWAYGIFQIDGDTLYFIGTADPKARPTDFTSRPGDGRYGYVCKRVRPER